MSFDSDLDHHDWLEGPHERPNATCAVCLADYYKARDDDGPLCERCAYDQWVSRKEREWREQQAKKYASRVVNE